jgi:hypothetical protein
MSLTMWKLLLPTLRKQMAKKTDEITPLMYVCFDMKKNSEDINTTMEFLSGARYKGVLDRDNSFYDIMMKNSAAISHDYEFITLLIDFENKVAVTSTYDKNNQNLTTNKY